jgi:anti-sigma factor RsiW
MEMTCPDARVLVPAYLDGELSEARSSPLRKHLLDCHACRTGAQDGKNLKRWFSAAREQADAAPLAVPSGFAARVARRAFAGDRGQLAPLAAPSTELVGASESTRKEGKLLRFVLAATAVAAAVALLLALAGGLKGREVGSSMSADDRALPPAKQVIEELERLNAQGAGAQQQTGGQPVGGQ